MVRNTRFIGNPQALAKANIIQGNVAIFASDDWDAIGNEMPVSNL